MTLDSDHIPSIQSMASRQINANKGRRMSLLGKVRLVLGSCVVVGCVATMSTRAVGADTSRIGTRIEDFTLRDFYGKEHSLSDYDADAVVVAFVGKISAGLQGSQGVMLGLHGQSAQACRTVRKEPCTIAF